jgi:hypothetical protein
MSTAIEFEKRFIGVHELARILDVDPESIYAKTSKRNRNNLNVAIPPWIKQGRLVKCGFLMSLLGSIKGERVSSCDGL